MQQDIDAVFAMNLIGKGCNVKKFCGCFVLCLGVGLSASAISEPWHHNHDMHRFHERNVTAWRGGYWYNGVRGGRRGSYWVIGGVYYYYPTAVHPYPNPYVPGVIYSVLRGVDKLLSLHTRVSIWMEGGPRYTITDPSKLIKVNRVVYTVNL